jgi:hypothetical protein
VADAGRDSLSLKISKRFLNDMCMDVRVASWLNSQGHVATHLRDEGLQRLPNGEIFDKAIAESRIIVTFDLDFGEIVALSELRLGSPISRQVKRHRRSCENFSYSLFQPSRNM